MVLYEYKIRSGKPPTPPLLLPAYRGDIHPRVDTVRRAGSERRRRWSGVGAHFNLKESFSTVLSAPCWRMQENPICLSIPVSTQWSDKSDCVLTWWSGKSMSPVPLAGPQHSSLKNGVGGGSLQGVLFWFCSQLKLFAWLTLRSDFLSNKSSKCLIRRAAQMVTELWIQSLAGKYDIIGQ